MSDSIHTTILRRLPHAIDQCYFGFDNSYMWKKITTHLLYSFNFFFLSFAPFLHSLMRESYKLFGPRGKSFDAVEKTTCWKDTQLVQDFFSSLTHTRSESERVKTVCKEFLGPGIKFKGKVGLYLLPLHKSKREATLSNNKKPRMTTVKKLTLCQVPYTLNKRAYHLSNQSCI